MKKIHAGQTWKTKGGYYAVIAEIRDDSPLGNYPVLAVIYGHTTKPMALRMTTSGEAVSGIEFEGLFSLDELIKESEAVVLLAKTRAGLDPETDAKLYDETRDFIGPENLAAIAASELGIQLKG